MQISNMFFVTFILICFIKNSCIFIKIHEYGKHIKKVCNKRRLCEKMR